MRRIFMAFLSGGLALAACQASQSTPGEETAAVGAALSVADEAGATCHAGPACEPGKPCADLTIDAARLRSSAQIEVRDFPDGDCAIVEGCVGGPGRRVLLRFDTATPNVGDGDMVLGAPEGNACFEFSSCHAHYHFKEYAQYTLVGGDGGTAAAGHKQAFCLEDFEPTPGSTAPPPSTLFDCSHQGIHAGYQDVYSSGLDCQWIDVTGVPAGTYTLNVAINYGHVLPESSYANNTASVTVTIPSEIDAGDPDGGPTDPCAAGGGCGSCTELPSCGWCRSTGGCFDGSESGPTSGSCADWAWLGDQCRP